MSMTNETDQAPPLKRRKLRYLRGGYNLCWGRRKTVGGEQKYLLCDTSTFFQKACNGQWREPKAKTVRLKEADPDSFAIYAYWLYTGQLDVLHNDTECSEVGHPACRSCGPLIDGYCLGDFLGDQAYCNFVTDTLLNLASRYHFTPSLAFINVHWPRLPKHSGMRRLLVDMQARAVKEDALRAIASSMPHENLVELMVALIKVRSVPLHECWEKRPKGYYHDKIKEPTPQKPEPGSQGC